MDCNTVELLMTVMIASVAIVASILFGPFFMLLLIAVFFVRCNGKEDNND